MAGPQTPQKIQFKGFGVALQQVTKTSAASPLITFYVYFSVVCLILTGLYDQLQKPFLLFWLVITTVYVIAFMIVFFTDPDRLRSEDYNIAIRQLLGGDKTTGLHDLGNTQPTQPIAIISDENKGKKR